MKPNYSVMNEFWNGTGRKDPPYYKLKLTNVTNEERNYGQIIIENIPIYPSSIQ